MASQTESFGEFARIKRRNAGLGLRQAAKKMLISAAYLSRVENDVDPPSAELIMKMSSAYACEIEELNAAAKRPSVSATTRGRSLELSEELRALYRMGGSLTAAEVEDMIRYVLKKRNMNMSEDEIEKELANLRSELPRIRNSQREGLFAADIKPRFLSKRAISAVAYKLLSDHGLDEKSYSPPTPIEGLAEAIDGVSYQIRELPSKDGEPIVLGLTRKDRSLERQIIVNSVLADSNRRTDAWRFNFTLAHELFHAIEHLTLVSTPSPAGMMRYRIPEPVYVERGFVVSESSRAKRAVDGWAKATGSRRLFTNEDWREWQANTFAAALLMPEWAVKEEFSRHVGSDHLPGFGGTGIREIALEIAGTEDFDGRGHDTSLAELFTVSRQAMAIRLIDLDLIREVKG